MLAVAIKRHTPFEAKIEELGKPGAKRHALTRVFPVADDDCTGSFGSKRSFISRAVIHDHH